MKFKYGSKENIKKGKEEKEMKWGEQRHKYVLPSNAKDVNCKLWEVIIPLNLKDILRR